MKNLTASNMSLQMFFESFKSTSFVNSGSVCFNCNTTCHVIQH